MPEATIVVLRRHGDQVVPEYADGALGSLDEVVSFEPTIAVVASPATSHIEALSVLIPLGAHVLVEKPLAASAAEARPLVEASRGRPQTVLVGYNLRFTDSMRRFRSELGTGLIGSPLSIRAEAGLWLPAWRPGADYRATVTAQRRLGGGVLLELSHELDYLGWLFGSPRWVMAHVSRQSALEIDVEDSAQVLFGVGEGSAATEMVGSLALDLIRRDRTRQCTVIGDAGTLRWDGVTGRVDVYESRSSSWRNLMQQSDDVERSYATQWRHFLDCIDGRAAPTTSLEDAYGTQMVIDACIESSREGRKALVRVDRQAGQDLP